ncbi:hypothetical protein [Campylobacter rectus]
MEKFTRLCLRLGASANAVLKIAESLSP